MRITEEEFKRAGELEEKFAMGGLSNKDLTLIIKAKKLIIAYLTGRGPDKWRLALTPLLHELYQLEDFVDARKRN